MLQHQSILRAALLILAAEGLFAAMGALVKALSETLPFEVIVFFRNIFSLLVLLPWLLRYGLTQLKTSVPHLHALRALIGCASLYCFFYALGKIPLGQGMLLKMTAPIFVPLVAYIWLREKTGTRALIAAGLGFIGVWIIINPGGELSQAALIGLIGGILVSGVHVCLRKLGRTEPTMRIVFYFTFLACIISAMPLLYVWQTPLSNEWLLMLLMGVSGAGGQLLMTRAYALAPVAQISPLTFSAVIYAVLFGYVFWQETISLRFMLGAGIIIISGSLVLYSRHSRVDVRRSTL